MATRAYLAAQIADGASNPVAKAALRTLLDEGVWQPWTDVASASSVALAAAGSRNVRITGTTTIASLGNADEGLAVNLLFAGAVRLTHGASLQLPYGRDLVTEAGAEATAIARPGNVWIVVAYTPASVAGGRAASGAAPDSWKEPVLVATTANITLSGEQTIDGIGVLAGDRVLVKNQTATAQNGIWIVGAGPWIRAADAADWAAIVGAAVVARQGTAGGGRVYIFAVAAGGTLGSTALPVASIGLPPLGAGLGLSGETLVLTAPIWAWWNFNGTGTPALRGSWNVSSITDNGVGDYTINFANAGGSANFAFVGSHGDGTIAAIDRAVRLGATTNASVRFGCTNNNGLVDPTFVTGAIIGG